MADGEGFITWTLDNCGRVTGYRFEGVAQDGTRCGHMHRTKDAAVKCGQKGRAA